MRADMGKVMMTPKGAYDSNTQYEIFDLVTNEEGSSYLAKAPSKGVPLTNTDKWEVLVDVAAAKQDVSDLKSANGQLIVNMGDSVFGNYSSPNDISTYLSKLTGATVYNCGFGGTRAVQRPETTEYTPNRRSFDLTAIAHAICEQDFTDQDAAITLGTDIPELYATRLATLKSIDFSEVNLLTLSYGTNDYAGSVELGDSEHPDDATTYFGALVSAANELLTTYPNLRIVFCTPLFRVMTVGSDTVPADTKKNSNGVTLTDFADMCEAAAKQIHSFAVNNYYMGINLSNYLNYCPDGTHPNELMRKMIAANMANNLFSGSGIGQADNGEIEDDIDSLKTEVAEYNEFAASQIGLPGVNITDISGYQLHDGALGSNGTWSNVNSKYQHVAIKVPQTGCRFQCGVSSTSPASLYYTFASQYDEPVNGQSYHAVTSAMPSGNVRNAIAKGGSLSVNLTDDVKYIILNTVWNENAVNVEFVSLTKAQTDGVVQTGISAVSASLATPYSNERPYRVGERCVVNNRVYECTTPITAPEEWDESKWKATDLGTAIDIIAKDTTFSTLESGLTGYLPAPAVNVTDLSDYQNYYGLMSKENGTWGSIHTSTNQYVIVPVPRAGCMFAVENGSNISLNIAGLKSYTPPQANGEQMDVSNFGFKTVAASGKIRGIPVTADTKYLAIQTLVNSVNANIVSFTLTNQALTGYLEQQIGTPEISITDLSGFTIRKGALGSNGNWSNINDNYKNITVPVPSTGCRLRIKVASGSPNLIFAGVTKLTDPVNGQSYYADGTLGRRSLSANGGLTGYDIPANVKYIVLNTTWNTNDVVIESFSITKAQSNGTIQNNLYNLKNARPMLSIIDNDGQRGSWNNWEEICDELGITASFALITGSVGAANYITWAEVDRLMGKGYGMLSHTNGHIHMGSTSDEAMEQDFIATTAALRQHGVRDMYLVYPYGERPASMTLVKKYFQCGVMTGVDNVNQPPINRWNIYRCSAVQTGDDNQINVEYEGQTYSVPRFKTFSELKSIIDNAIEKRAFLVLMTHLRNYPPTGYYYDSAAKAVLEQALTYAAGHGVDIVPFAEGYKRFVNRFESSNVTVDCNGNVIEN